MGRLIGPVGVQCAVHAAPQALHLRPEHLLLPGGFLQQALGLWGGRLRLCQHRLPYQGVNLPHLHRDKAGFLESNPRQAVSKAGLQLWTSRMKNTSVHDLHAFSWHGKHCELVIAEVMLSEFPRTLMRRTQAASILSKKE